MTDLSERLARNKHMPRYLNQLAELTGSQVSEDQLGSIGQVESVKSQAIALKKKLPVNSFCIDPRDLAGDRFHVFVQKLKAANCSPVSIWIEPSSVCGLMFISSIDNFNFSFDFDVVPEGLIVLQSEGVNDEVLLDFSPDEVEVEVCGETWGGIEY